VSDRFRKPVYGEIGHTIMSLLCDTRNFQYTIPQIDGLSIQLDGAHTKITIPESQYDFIIKSLLTSNDYVFSLACLQMDDSCGSHLTAIENENLGSYSSKTVTSFGAELASSEPDSTEGQIEINKKRKKLSYTFI
jgi:MAD (mothers against decapentaplegic) interacting protein